MANEIELNTTKPKCTQRRVIMSESVRPVDLPEISPPLPAVPE